MIIINNDLIPTELLLSNGMKLNGFSPMLYNKLIFGEVVFNTGMLGYEETLTDPSYRGQILTFTYPIIGNYGVDLEKIFWESENIHTKGVICQNVYDFTQTEKKISFLDWLKKENIPIIMGIDTRYLTSIIRNNGSMTGVIRQNKDIIDFDQLILDTNLVEQTSTKKIVEFGHGKYKIIVVDCGCKQNIIRKLLQYDFKLKIVPFDYDYSNEDYDGIFISNGPGDPKICNKTIAILKNVIKNTNKPIYGICLGAQLLALANNFDTYKLKYGHRGQNHPCVNLETNKCYLTTQNHGYAINADTIDDKWIISFKHLNDNTVAGIKHKIKPFSAVQFHPESSPGPHDASIFFDEFFLAVTKYN